MRIIIACLTALLLASGLVEDAYADNIRGKGRKAKSEGIVGFDPSETALLIAEELNLRDEDVVVVGVQGGKGGKGKSKGCSKSSKKSKSSKSSKKSKKNGNDPCEEEESEQLLLCKVDQRGYPVLPSDPSYDSSEPRFLQDFTLSEVNNDIANGVVKFNTVLSGVTALSAGLTLAGPPGVAAAAAIGAIGPLLNVANLFIGLPTNPNQAALLGEFDNLNTRLDQLQAFMRVGFEKIGARLSDRTMDTIMVRIQAINEAFQNNVEADPRNRELEYATRFRDACNEPHFTPEDIFRGIYGHGCGDNCTFGLRKQDNLLSQERDAANYNVNVFEEGFGNWIISALLQSMFFFVVCPPPIGGECTDRTQDLVWQRTLADMNRSIAEVQENIDEVSSEFRRMWHNNIGVERLGNFPYDDCDLDDPSFSKNYTDATRSDKEFVNECSASRILDIFVANYNDEEDDISYNFEVIVYNWRPDFDAVISFGVDSDVSRSTDGVFQPTSDGDGKVFYAFKPDLKFRDSGAVYFDNVQEKNVHIRYRNNITMPERKDASTVLQAIATRDCTYDIGACQAAAVALAVALAASTFGGSVPASIAAAVALEAQDQVHDFCESADRFWGTIESEAGICLCIGVPDFDTCYNPNGLGGVPLSDEGALVVRSGKGNSNFDYQLKSATNADSVFWDVNLKRFDGSLSTKITATPNDNFVNFHVFF
jgi:hypothetical protein